MAAPSSRQRRTFAPPLPHSYPANPITTTTTPHSSSQTHSLAILPSLISSWHRARINGATPFAQRAAMRLLEVALLALALFLVPACIQHFVRALDTLYEVVGRRARTSLDEVGWWRVGVGGGVLAAWHVVLIALSLKAIAGHGQSGKRGGRQGAWSRVLGRVVVPGYLVVALAAFVYALTTRLAAPRAVPMDASAQASTPYG